MEEREGRRIARGVGGPVRADQAWDPAQVAGCAERNLRHAASRPRFHVKLGTGPKCRAPLTPGGRGAPGSRPADGDDSHSRSLRQTHSEGEAPRAALDPAEHRGGSRPRSPAPRVGRGSWLPPSPRTDPSVVPEPEVRVQKSRTHQTRAPSAPVGRTACARLGCNRWPSLFHVKRAELHPTFQVPSPGGRSLPLSLRGCRQPQASGGTIRSLDARGCAPVRRRSARCPPKLGVRPNPARVVVGGGRDAAPPVRYAPPSVARYAASPQQRSRLTTPRVSAVPGPSTPPGHRDYSRSGSAPATGSRGIRPAALAHRQGGSPASSSATLPLQSRDRLCVTEQSPALGSSQPAAPRSGTRGHSSLDRAVVGPLVAAQAGLRGRQWVASPGSQGRRRPDG
ncbi:hypothetical protein GA0070611_4530 [Micromonospora auratinigra]|uniref:Uncharacterized protein n=1 Tax=Micromonospora auratinigra TaxID=261654 RepID=A0A1A9A0T8_9ACTN|nr:hypothetical protein GA0070611_4530 [Micromonospora auratinigra]